MAKRDDPHLRTPNQVAHGINPSYKVDESLGLESDHKKLAKDAVCAALKDSIGSVNESAVRRFFEHHGLSITPINVKILYTLLDWQGLRGGQSQIAERMQKFADKEGGRIFDPGPTSYIHSFLYLQRRHFYKPSGTQSAEELLDEKIQSPRPLPSTFRISDPTPLMVPIDKCFFERVRTDPSFVGNFLRRIDKGYKTNFIFLRMPSMAKFYSQDCADLENALSESIKQVGSAYNADNGTMAHVILHEWEVMTTRVYDPSTSNRKNIDRLLAHVKSNLEIAYPGPPQDVSIQDVCDLLNRENGFEDNWEGRLDEELSEFSARELWMLEEVVKAIGSIQTWESIASVSISHFEKVKKFAHEIGVREDQIYFLISNRDKSFSFISQFYTEVNNIDPTKLKSARDMITKNDRSLSVDDNTPRLFVCVDDLGATGNTSAKLIAAQYSEEIFEPKARKEGGEVVSPIQYVSTLAIAPLFTTEHAFCSVWKVIGQQLRFSGGTILPYDNKYYFPGEFVETLEAQCLENIAQIEEMLGGKSKLGYGSLEVDGGGYGTFVSMPYMSSNTNPCLLAQLFLIYFSSCLKLAYGQRVFMKDDRT